MPIAPSSWYGKVGSRGRLCSFRDPTSRKAVKLSAPILTFHGASRTVTGSCYHLALGDHQLLVDCGLFQGSRSLEALNLQPFAFDPARIDAVLVTHAHLDHSGLLPRLSANGFRG